MNKVEKNELLVDLSEKFSKAQVALFADYKGLSSMDADDLRKAIRATDGEVKVIKNNIARLVGKEGKLGAAGKELLDRVVGPTLVAFAYKDVAATAKVFFKFSEDKEALKLKESLMGTTRIDANEIKELASLPSKQVLLAKLLGTLNAPATNFVGVLAAVPRSLLNVLTALEAKKKDS